MDAGAGEGMVTHHAAVELDTARQPGVTDGQVTGAHHGVIVQEVLPRHLIVERPETAAQLGEEQCLEVLILQHHADVRGQLLGAVVEILHTVGENGGEEAVADKQLVILVQGGAGQSLDIGHLVERGESGFTVEFGGGEEDFADCHGHGGDSFRGGMLGLL